MALPRPVLLAVLGLALCAAAFLATRGAKDPGGAITAAPTPSPAATPAPAKHEPAKQAPKAHKAAPSQSDTEAQAERALNRASQAAVPARERDSARKAPAQQQPAKPAKPTKPTAQQTAVEVTKALGKGDAVVFFFTHHGAADD